MRHLFDRIVPFLAVCALFSGMLHADEWETQRADHLERSAQSAEGGFGE